MTSPGRRSSPSPAPPKLSAAERNAYSTRLIVLLFVAHGVLNSLLLSAWNPMRCAFWNKARCSDDEAWMCNWQSFSHFHVMLLVAVMATSLPPPPMDRLFLSRLAHVCMGLSILYLVEGIFVLDQLNKSFAAVQCISLLATLASVLYVTWQAEQQVFFGMAPVVYLKRTTSYDRRSKLPVATVALLLQLFSASLRVVDMTFGSGRRAYMGDSTSPVYRATSGLAVSDMLVSALLLLFILRYGTVAQQKSVLVGQAAMLFVSLAMLVGGQGERLDPDMAKAGATGTFLFLIVAMVGAM